MILTGQQHTVDHGGDYSGGQSPYRTQLHYHHQVLLSSFRCSDSILSRSTSPPARSLMFLDHQDIFVCEHFTL